LEAVNYVDAMQTAPPLSIQLRALVHAAVVSYARPFTKSQITRDHRVVPLRGILPPPHFACLHKELLTMRDKVIGHKDVTLGEEKSGVPNIVVIKRGENGATSLRTIAVASFSVEKLAGIRELCAHFINYCNEQGRPLMERCQSAVFSLPPATYELLVSEPPKEWVRPISDSWLANHDTFQ